MSSPLSGDRPLTGAERRRYLREGLRTLSGRGRAVHTRGFALSTHGREAREKIREGASPWRTYSSGVLEQLLPAAEGPAGAACDIGCGPGAHTRFFGEPSSYVGIDIVQQLAWRRTEHAQFVVCAGEALALRASSVRLTFSSSTLEHVSDPSAVFRECARVTKAGGSGIHIVPGEWSLFLYMFHGSRRFTPQSLDTLARDAGLEIAALWSLGGLASFILHLVWITWLETGAVYGWLAFAHLRSGARVPHLGSRMRTGLGLRIYRPLLRAALAVDRFVPVLPAGYVVVLRRP